MGDWHFIVGRLVQKRCTTKKMHYFFTYRNFIRKTSHDALLPKWEWVQWFIESGRVAVQGKDKPSANPGQREQRSFTRRAALQSFQVRAASFMTKTQLSLISTIQNFLCFNAQCNIWGSHSGTGRDSKLQACTPSPMINIGSLTDQHRLSILATITICCEWHIRSITDVSEELVASTFRV